MAAAPSPRSRSSDGMSQGRRARPPNTRAVRVRPAGSIHRSSPGGRAVRGPSLIPRTIAQRQPALVVTAAKASDSRSTRSAWRARARSRLARGLVTEAATEVMTARSPPAAPERRGVHRRPSAPTTMLITAAERTAQVSPSAPASPARMTGLGDRTDSCGPSRSTHRVMASAPGPQQESSQPTPSPARTRAFRSNWSGQTTTGRDAAWASTSLKTLQMG